MHQSKYSLTWDSYSDHLNNMMKDLMLNEDFSNVTLVTEDKKHIKANIHILSSCSPVFQDILKKEHKSSPTIFLRGIQYSEMESIIQFIYLGEATFYEERIDELLAVAKSLEIKELCNAGAETRRDSETSPSDPIAEEVKEVKGVELKKEPTVMTDQTTKQAPRDEEEVPCSFVYTQGLKYACNQCDYEAKQQWQLNIHIQSKHEGVKYDCDKCDYQAIRHDHLTRHIKSKHEGVRYACDWCSFQSTRKDHLTRHIQSKHEGAKYACDQCDFQATNQIHLTKHIDAKH